MFYSLCILSWLYEKVYNIFVYLEINDLMCLEHLYNLEMGKSELIWWVQK